MARIAEYRTRTSAEKYAADLRKVFPQWDFRPITHPINFTWSVGLFQRDNSDTDHFGCLAYALKVKRREIGSALNHLGNLHKGLQEEGRA